MVDAAQNLRIGTTGSQGEARHGGDGSRGIGSYANYVGRVGALAVALGVGFAIASSGSGVAHAEDTSASDSSGATKSSSTAPGKASSQATASDDDADASDGTEDSEASEESDDEDKDDEAAVDDDEGDDSIPTDEDPEADDPAVTPDSDAGQGLLSEIEDETSDEVQPSEPIEVDVPTAEQPQEESPEPNAPTAEAETPETVAAPVAVKSSTALATLDAPESPAQPTLWTILGQLISDLQRTWFNRRPDLDYQQVDVTLDEVDDTSDPIAFGGTDPDGDELTYWTPRRGSLFGPRHGNVTIDQATGTFTYNADDAFAVTGGRDTFLVRVSDYAPGEFHLHTLFGGHTDYALVTVVVAPTNRPPVAGNDSVKVDEDGLLNVNPADLLANDTDADGDSLTIEGYTQPEHGDLWINRDGTISYNPDDDYHGVDTFTYTVTDGTQSVTATVTVNVIAVPDAPVAGNDTVGVDEDGLLNVNPADLLANDSDADGDSLTIEGYTQPEHGDLWINRDGTISYNPDDDYHGVDTFTYTVTDGTQSVTATVTVNVKPVNDAPVAGDDAIKVDEDGFVIVNPSQLLANDSDIDGDNLTIDGYTQPEHGDLWINRDGSISYDPDDDYHGVDTFTYTVTDGTQSVTATVTVNVAAVQDAPVANDDTVNVDEDGLLNVNPADLLANDSDVDGDLIAIEGYTQPEHGDLWINRDGSISYNPDDDYHGVDTFTYTVTDGTQSVTATVTVNVKPVNDAPVAGDDAVSVDEDGLLNVNPADLLANDTDADADSLTIEGYTQPEHGDLWINRDGTISYNPDDDYHGVDTFTYTVTDGTQSVTATVTVNVISVPDGPTANNDALSATEDQPLTFNPIALLGNDSSTNGTPLDANGDGLPDNPGLTIESFTQPANGTLVRNPNGTFTFTPDGDFNGVDTFTYTIVEGGVASVPATVTITVAAVPDAPGAATVDVGEPNPLSGVVAGSVVGTDPDGDTITYSAPTRTAHGTVTIDAATGNFTYTPDDDAREALSGAPEGGTIRLTDPSAVTQGTFLGSNGGLYRLDHLAGTGSAVRNFVATFFTATSTQTYVFGQTEAPVDTVMIVYRGTFDPQSPATGAAVLNDDFDDETMVGAGCGRGHTLCPRVSLHLEAGEQVSIVVTTYSAGDPLGLPQAFFTSGPGQFTTISPEDSFIVTMSDGNGGTTDVTVRVPILPLDDAIEA